MNDRKRYEEAMNEILSAPDPNKNAKEAVKATMAERMKAAGYGVDSTGGGCVAWGKSFKDGSYLWITDDSGCCLGETPDENYLVGWYDAEGEELKDARADNLDDALAIATEWTKDVP